MNRLLSYIFHETTTSHITLTYIIMAFFIIIIIIKIIEVDKPNKILVILKNIIYIIIINLTITLLVFMFKTEPNNVNELKEYHTITYNENKIQIINKNNNKTLTFNATKNNNDKIILTDDNNKNATFELTKEKIKELFTNQIKEDKVENVNIEELLK